MATRYMTDKALSHCSSIASLHVSDILGVNHCPLRSGNPQKPECATLRAVSKVAQTSSVRWGGVRPSKKKITHTGCKLKHQHFSKRTVPVSTSSINSSKQESSSFSGDETNINGDSINEDKRDGKDGGVDSSLATQVGVGEGEYVVGSLADSGADMMKLFNDAQQNMLYLNRARVTALEALHKAQREMEYLAARTAQLEAENAAVQAEREVLEQRLRGKESTLTMIKARSSTGASNNSSYSNAEADSLPGTATDNSSIAKTGGVGVLWSSLHLRIDSLLLASLLDSSQAGKLRSMAWARDHRLEDRLLAAAAAAAAPVQQQVSEWSNEQLAVQLKQVLANANSPRLHVVQVCTEMAPVASAGSLASWITGLCSALRKKGHLVEVLLPRYGCLDVECVEGWCDTGSTFQSYFGGKYHANKLYTGCVCGIPVTFIEPCHPANLFAQRDQLYGYDDDFDRFTYFSRACLDWMRQVDKQPHVIHLHNWHTAAIAPLFWDHFCKQGLSSTRLLFTCHNFKYQHLVEPSRLSLCGLDPAQLQRPDRLQDNQEASKANLLKGGIVYSNKVTTVSPVYAHALLQSRSPAATACGLETTLQTHKNKFVGLPSGLDSAVWDPSRDTFLPMHFSHTDMSGKTLAKAELRQTLGLPMLEPSTGVPRPLVACVLPVVFEDELELLRAAMECALANGAQFVAVGASKSPKIQAQLEELQRERADENAEVVIRMDTALAHLVVAAADIFLCLDARIPTAESPFIALKYGALPVSRRQVGGGFTHIIDLDDPQRGLSEGNGFLFHNYTVSDIAETLARAINKKIYEPEFWDAAVATGMQLNSTWDADGSSSYIEAYLSILP